jgi:hypothetical protein
VYRALVQEVTTSSGRELGQNEVVSSLQNSRVLQPAFIDIGHMQHKFIVQCCCASRIPRSEHLTKTGVFGAVRGKAVARRSVRNVSDALLVGLPYFFWVQPRTYF